MFRNYRNQSFKDFKNDKLATVRNQLGRVRLLFTGLVISFSAMLAGLVFGSHVNFTEIKLSFFAIKPYPHTKTEAGYTLYKIACIYQFN